jgi:hypothetical protein
MEYKPEEQVQQPLYESPTPYMGKPDRKLTLTGWLVGHDISGCEWGHIGLALVDEADDYTDNDDLLVNKLGGMVERYVSVRYWVSNKKLI